MSQGWISISRKLLESDDWKSEKFSRSQAWIDLIGLAKFSDFDKNGSQHTLRVRGIKVTLKRGQVGYSTEKLAIRWKWSRNKVSRFLKELEDDESIEQQKGNVINLISITNYNSYQSNEATERQQKGKQKDSKRVNRKDAEGEQLNKENKENNVEQPNNENNILVSIPETEPRLLLIHKLFAKRSKCLPKNIDKKVNHKAINDLSQEEFDTLVKFYKLSEPKSYNRLLSARRQKVTTLLPELDLQIQNAFDYFKTEENGKGKFLNDFSVPQAAIDIMKKEEEERMKDTDWSDVPD